MCQPPLFSLLRLYLFETCNILFGPEDIQSTQLPPSFAAPNSPFTARNLRISVSRAIS